MTTRTEVLRFGNFLFGGGATALIGMGLLFGMVQHLHIGYTAAFTIQLIVTLALNFAYSHLVTWRGLPTISVQAQARRFLVTRGISQLLSLLIFATLISAAVGLHYLAANIVCLGFATLFNWYTSNIFVFAHSHGQHRAPGRAQLKLPAPLARIAALTRDNATAAAGIALAVLIGAIVVTLGLYITSLILIFVIALLSGTFAIMETNWRQFGWRTPEAIDGMGFAPLVEHCGNDQFSIIVCAKDEPYVLTQTLELLARQTHPQVQIIASLIKGDDPTIQAAETARIRYPDRIVILVEEYEKNMKPYQLNAALRLCTGKYVGVIDAEDIVAPELLESVEATFQHTDADIVQGGVQLMNLGSRLREWFCVHNVLEYKFWFSSRMMYQAQLKFVPLGGNTVFIRRELLVEAGGWPVSLTEDCALGVKLSTQYGATVVAAYDPKLVTREETPDDIRGLVHQRVRWVAGFGSELLQKQWWHLPTFRQRFIAWYILATPFIQAITGLLLPISILSMLLLEAPVGLVLLTFLPYIPIFLTLALQTVGLHEFGVMYGQPVKIRHYAFLVFGFIPYQIVLSWAAIRAVAKIFKKDMEWWKTPHSGKHLTDLTPQPVPEAVA